MKRYFALAAIMLMFSAVSFADGPAVSPEGKLFGLKVVPGAQVGEDVLYSLYEKSAATAAFVSADWAKTEAADPGNAQSTYDYSAFDKQPFMQSTKKRICVIVLANSWADSIKARDPERYWKLTESFVTAVATHANAAGVRYFKAPELVAGELAQANVERLAHVYKAVKAASKENMLIGGSVGVGGASAQTTYDFGAKGLFDVFDLRIAPAAPPTGVNMHEVVIAHRAMVANGDGDKQIFISEGWGAVTVPGVARTNPTSPASDAEIDALRSTVENGFRAILTERDIYDPKWVLGAQFRSLNDGYPRKDEFSNSGLVDIQGKPKSDLLDSFKPAVPAHKFEAYLDVESGPVFNYVPGKTYRLRLTITNQTDSPISLSGCAVNMLGMSGVTAKPQGDVPTTTAPGASSTAEFALTFPKEAAGKQVTLVGEMNYAIGQKKYSTDCWLTVNVSPQFEITLLPARMIVTPGEPAKRVGMSVINHADEAFDGKITMKAAPGIKVEPAEIATKIDAGGLEGYVFGVSVDKSVAPGHYAVFVDVGGKAWDWQAVDVPVLAKKAKIKIDANLDDWKDSAKFSIAMPTIGADGKIKYTPVGTGWFAYDDSNLYAAVEIDDAEPSRGPDSKGIRIAFDPAINGARSGSGGYKDDDAEYWFSTPKDKPVVFRAKGADNKPIGEVSGVPFQYRKDSAKRFYEVAIPWSELSPFAPARDKMLAVSILANYNDTSGPVAVEWGGGITGKKDPRKFIPVVLTE